MYTQLLSDSGDNAKNYNGFEEVKTKKPFLSPQFYTMHRTVLMTVAIIKYAEAIKFFN